VIGIKIRTVAADTPSRGKGGRAARRVNEGDEVMKMSNELTRAEVRQVEIHKWYMSQRCGFDVGFETAKEDWLANHATVFWQRRHKVMMDLQREAINRHKWIVSEQCGCDQGRTAVLDWIAKYAATWREWYEEEYDGSELEEVAR
jgi:hypothetical protein